MDRTAIARTGMGARRLVLVCAALAFCDAAAAECALTSFGAVEVASVRDGRTLGLADGRELRLAAIETDRASRPALEKLVAGRHLDLKVHGDATDRYGRIVAYAYRAGDTIPVQQHLLAEGWAQVAARPGSPDCAALLFATERAARGARKGLWNDPNFAPLTAVNLSGLTARRGRFALVEGKVLSVRESGATIYVNFGRYWTRDFTVTILKRLHRTFAGSGLDPKSLEGRRIRVRGYIEQRSGPVIAADQPGQIELID